MTNQPTTNDLVLLEELAAARLGSAIIKMQEQLIKLGDHVLKLQKRVNELEKTNGG